MYFGSVKFFKHVIVVVTILLIAVPAVFCFILNSKLSKAEDENRRLRDDISEYRLSEHTNTYEADEFYSLYKDCLSDKEGFLRLVSSEDLSMYKSAAGLDGTVLTSSYSTKSTTEAVTAAPATSSETESGTVNDDTEPEITTTDVPHAAYESLYPELYAEVPDDIVYDLDMDYVYLTFDDGPSRYTENILYYLDAYDIKATFFVVPDGTDESNARLKKIAERGHTIGIHTATHEYNKIYASVEDYLEDFKTAYDRVYAATGIKCNLFRFPGGSINDYNTEIREDLIAEMTRRGFIYFDWNVDSSDALGATWTEMYNAVLSQTADVNRAVILMHDYNGGYNTVLVLEDIIKALISDKRGYKLAKLTESVKPIQF